MICGDESECTKYRHPPVRRDNLTNTAQLLGMVRDTVYRKCVLFTHVKSHVNVSLFSKLMTLKGVMMSDAHYLCRS